MKNIDKLIQGNVQCLLQLTTVISSLPSKEYQCQVHSFQGVGVHVRHIAEHYEQFFSGLTAGRINYDERPRNYIYEVNQEAAIQKLKALNDQLLGLSSYDSASRIQLTACTDGRYSLVAEGVETSVERELLFVYQHAIHHCAQIAILVSLLGKPVGSVFGLAPATLKYQKEQAGNSPA